jgi:predicted nucleic acid-binding protein
VARVLIDTHMFSVDWFKSILSEMVDSPKVVFVFSNCAKGIQEISKVRKAFEFRKLMTNTRRVREAPPIETETHFNILMNNKQFKKCNDCDDPHIMAAIYLNPTKFVFSKDTRMAKCRKHLSGKIDKRYCNFIVISKIDLYNEHRPHILK